MRVKKAFLFLFIVVSLASVVHSLVPTTVYMINEDEIEFLLFLSNLDMGGNDILNIGSLTVETMTITNLTILNTTNATQMDVDILNVSSLLQLQSGGTLLFPDNIITNVMIDSLNANQLTNIAFLDNKIISSIDNITNLISSTQCSGTDKLRNVTITSSGITGICAADQTGAGGVDKEFVGPWLFNTSSQGFFNDTYANETYDTRYINAGENNAITLDISNITGINVSKECADTVNQKVVNVTLEGTTLNIVCVADLDTDTTNGTSMTDLVQSINLKNGNFTFTATPPLSIVETVNAFVWVFDNASFAILFENNVFTGNNSFDGNNTFTNNNTFLGNTTFNPYGTGDVIANEYDIRIGGLDAGAIQIGNSEISAGGNMTVGSATFNGSFLILMNGTNPPPIFEFVLGSVSNNAIRWAVPVAGIDLATQTVRSMMVGGIDAGAFNNNIVNCTLMGYTAIDCDTDGTGADLGVQDDLEVLGKIFTNDWTNVSITESQISDLVHTTNGTSMTDLVQSINLKDGNFTFTATFPLAITETINTFDWDFDNTSYDNDAIRWLSGNSTQAQLLDEIAGNLSAVNNTVAILNNTVENSRADIIELAFNQSLLNNSLEDLENNVSGKVNKTGDTMTGTLRIDASLFVGNVNFSNESSNGFWNGSLIIITGNATDGSGVGVVFEEGGGGGNVPYAAFKPVIASRGSVITGSLILVNRNVSILNSSDITLCQAWANDAGIELKLDCNSTGRGFLGTGPDFLLLGDFQAGAEVWIPDREGEIHNMSTELSLRDEMTNNIVFDSIQGMIDGSLLKINSTLNESLILNIERNNTNLQRINDSIVLTLGTDTEPQSNFVSYQGKQNPVLTVDTDHTSNPHAEVCSISIGTVDNVFWGVCGSHSIDEFITRISHHLIELGLLYNQDFNITSSASDISIGPGIYDIVGEEKTTLNTLTMSDDYFIILSNGSYRTGTDLTIIEEYGDGQAFDNTVTARIAVVWGAVLLPNTTATRLMAIVQSKSEDEANKDTECDGLNPTFLNTFPNDRDADDIFLPIAKTCIRVQDGSETFITLESTGAFHQDIRGTTKGAGGAPPSGGDNLGDHMATTHLNMSGNNITEIGNYTLIDNATFSSYLSCNLETNALGQLICAEDDTGASLTNGTQFTDLVQTIDVSGTRSWGNITIQNGTDGMVGISTDTSIENAVFTLGFFNTSTSNLDTRELSDNTTQKGILDELSNNATRFNTSATNLEDRVVLFNTSATNLEDRVVLFNTSATNLDQRQTADNESICRLNTDNFHTGSLNNFTGTINTSNIISKDWSNVSITESQVSDLSHTTDTNVKTLCADDLLLTGDTSTECITQASVASLTQVVAGTDIDVSTNTVSLETTLDSVTVINGFFDPPCAAGFYMTEVDTGGSYSCTKIADSSILLSADNITSGFFSTNFTFTNNNTFLNTTFYNSTGELNRSVNTTCIIFRGATSRLSIC